MLVIPDVEGLYCQKWGNCILGYFPIDFVLSQSNPKWGCSTFLLNQYRTLLSNELHGRRCGTRWPPPDIRNLWIYGGPLSIMTITLSECICDEREQIFSGILKILCDQYSRKWGGQLWIFGGTPIARGLIKVWWTPSWGVGVNSLK